MAKKRMKRKGMGQMPMTAHGSMHGSMPKGMKRKMKKMQMGR